MVEVSPLTSQIEETNICCINYVASFPLDKNLNALLPPITPATPYTGTGNPSIVSGSSVLHGIVTGSSSVERSIAIEQTALKSQEASTGPAGKGLKEKRKFSELRSSNLDQDFMLDEQFTFQLQDR